MPRESFSFIEKPNGDLAWYKTKVKTYNRLSRAMNFVVGCHLSSQTEQISRWLSNDKKYPTHVIMTRITDDTNVWVDPQDSSAADSADSGEDNDAPEGKSNGPNLEGKDQGRSGLGLYSKDLCAVSRGDIAGVCASTRALSDPSEGLYCHLNLSVIC